MFRAEGANEQPAVVLTIAGFDPSGGAGIIADIKTIVALGCRPLAAITSITFQNSGAVFGTVHQTADSVRSQVAALLGEFRIDGLKIGMLATSELVAAVTTLVRDYELPAPVLDPVMNSSSGNKLMTEGVAELMVRELMPLARVITPNIPEAEALTGLKITDEDLMLKAASKLRELGARAVLLKGGHLFDHSQRAGEMAIDMLDDGGSIKAFRSEWIDRPTVRGTGCMLSSAIAAGLAQKMTLSESVKNAKRFVAEAIRSAPGSTSKQTFPPQSAR